MIELANIFFPRTVRGLTISIHEDGSNQCAHMALVSRQGVLTRVDSLQFCDGLEGLSDVSKKEPLVITIVGKGIVQRVLSAANTNHKQVVSQVIPGSKPDEYVSEVYSTDKTNLVGVCRKTLVAQVENQITKLGFRVLDTNLGVKNLGYALELANENLVADGNFTLLVNESEEFELSKVGHVSYQMHIAKEEVAQEELQVFMPVMRTLLLIDCESENFQTNISEEKYRLAIRSVGIASVAVLFVALLANLLTFQGLTKDVQRLTVENSIHENMFQALDSIKTEVALKHELIARNGVSKLSNFAEFSDRIGKSVGGKINLTKLELALRKGKHEAKKPLRFAFESLQLEGETNSDQDMNHWLDDLKKLDFVDQVRFLGYSSENKVGKFSLEIDVR